MPNQPSDRLEKVANRRHTNAMQLLRRIVEDLPHDGFTEDEVRDSFNALACGAGFIHGEDTLLIRYGRSHLNYLVENELLERAEGVYTVNGDHPFVAQLLGFERRTHEEQ